MKHNYTYQITNTLTSRYYIGVRSCNILPIDDIGKIYFSSSSDANFMAEQKETSYFTYEILGEFSSREEAVQHEVFLHMFYDVGANPSCYNKAKQTSTGFDKTGMIISQETRDKMSKAQIGKTLSHETKDKIKQFNIGRKHTQETKDKISVNNSGSNHGMYGIHHTQETKDKISKNHIGMRGKHHTQETKDKMIKTRLSRVPLSCPHCGFTGKNGASNSVIKRWHFDNCKFKDD